MLMVMACLVATPGFAGDMKRVRLALQWYPQAQFAGYYMALEKGFYENQGLDVELIPGGVGFNSLDLVRYGDAEFATSFLSTAIKMRSQGVKLVNIGQFVQRSALMLIARKDSGIKTIKDLDGARIGTWGDEFQLQPKALFEREGMDVTMVRQSPSFELFMRGGLDAVLAMWYNEYHRLISYGLNPDEMTTFFFSDLELNQPEDGIYCLQSTLDKSPETAAALISASVQGWRYAFDHPEETIDTMLAVMKQKNIRANRAHQSWMLARMKDVIMPKGTTTIDTRLGWNDFLGTKAAILYTEGERHDIPYTDFYKEPAQ